jgi:hypothetical protein
LTEASLAKVTLAVADVELFDALALPVAVVAADPVLAAAADVALPLATAELVELVYWAQKFKTACKSLPMVEFLAAQHC